MSNNIKIENTDLVLSKIGFGTVNAGLAWDNEDAFEILERYVNLGGNVIDCARIYSDWVEPEIGRAERVIGDWIRHRGKRDDLVIMTKGGHPKMDTMNVSRMSKEDMEYDLNLSLNALGINCIDIYFYHRDDLSQPVSDLIDVMEGFVREGKIRYYGCSNWTTKRMIEADNYCKEKGYRGFVANQMLFNIASDNMKPFPDETMVTMDKEMMNYHKNSNNLAMPYFGLCSGFFQKLETKGKEVVIDSPYYTEGNLKRAKQINYLKEKYNATTSQILLGYILNQDVDMVPLAGASKIEQLEDFMETININFDKDNFRF